MAGSAALNCCKTCGPGLDRWKVVCQVDTAAAHLTVMVAELASMDSEGVARLDRAKRAMTDLHNELASADTLQPISVHLSGLSSFKKQAGPPDPEASTQCAVPPWPGSSVVSLISSLNLSLVEVRDEFSAKQ